MLEPNKFPDIVAVTQSNVATMCDPPGGQPCVILVVPSVSEALTANPAYVSKNIFVLIIRSLLFIC